MDRARALFVRACLLRDIIADRRAVTALEYGLIAALIAAAIVGGVGTLGSRMSSTFVSVSGKL